MAAPTSGLGPLGNLLLLLLLATPTWVASVSHRHPKSPANSVRDVGRSLFHSLGGGPFFPGGTSALRPGLAPSHSPTRCPLPDPWPAPPLVRPRAHSAIVSLLSLWPASSAGQDLGWNGGTGSEMAVAGQPAFLWPSCMWWLHPQRLLGADSSTLL